MRYDLVLLLALAVAAFVTALTFAILEGFSITFERADPTIFNVVSDWVSEATRFGFVLAFGQVYVYLMTWHIETGKNIPIAALGSVPSNLWESTQLVRFLQCSVPALLMTLLFLLAEYSHSVADLGLDFVTVQVEGPPDTILNLQKRNEARLIQTAGDPIGIRTSVIATAILSADRETGGQHFAVAHEFVNAFDGIARGGSPFTQFFGSGEVDSVPMWGGVNVTSMYYSDGATLSKMNLEIPLNCSSDEMMPIDQSYALESGGVDATALVPECSFSNVRLSGIYEGGGSVDFASILELVVVIPQDDETVVLKDGSESFQKFNATPEMKALARDRENWYGGRAITNIDGIQIGTVDIRFGAVVLASSGHAFAYWDRTEERWVSFNSYGLIAEIVGECPPRPSGLSARDNRCMAIVDLICEEFPEDIEYKVRDDVPRSDSECDLQYVNVVWGDNFPDDADMVPVVAGIYGRAKPDGLIDVWSMISFLLFGIYGAMFAVGSLDVRPTVLEEVRPRVNETFIVFKLLPVFLISMVLLVAVVATTIVREHRIPLNAWELLIMGHEEAEIANIPRRESKTEPYAKPDSTLRLALLQKEQHSQEIGIVRYLASDPQEHPDVSYRC